MKRRTLRRHRDASKHHHNVYVVLLGSAGAGLKNAAKTSRRVYVGMTGLTPEQRFANHKQGIKAARVVQRHGIRLLPELYTHLNPMPFEAAAQMEKDLADDLRHAGYTVLGGH